MDNKKTQQVGTIGWAVSEMVSGAKVARHRWNGKGMYIYHVGANLYPVNINEKKTMSGIWDDMVIYQAYIAMKTVDNTVVPWLCSQSDLLANDWEYVNG